MVSRRVSESPREGFIAYKPLSTRFPRNLAARLPGPTSPLSLIALAGNTSFDLSSTDFVHKMSEKQWKTLIQSGEFDHLEDAIVNGGGDTVVPGLRRATDEELKWMTLLFQTIFVSARLLRRQQGSSKNQDLLTTFLNELGCESSDALEDGLEFMQKMAKKRELRSQCKKFLKNLSGRRADEAERLVQLSSSELSCVRTYVNLLSQKGPKTVSSPQSKAPGRSSHNSPRASFQRYVDTVEDGSSDLSSSTSPAVLAAPGYLALEGMYQSSSYSTLPSSAFDWSSASTTSDESVPRAAPIISSFEGGSMAPSKPRHFRLPSESQRWSAIPKGRS